ncbi:MAG: FtsQ-type POTRA domain-containing protein [Desulfobacterales bacterium]|nr:FtsQ-type POTRA domain-containing protein [Desulfobacterales bacterium]
MARSAGRRSLGWSPSPPAAVFVSLFFVFVHDVFTQSEHFQARQIQVEGASAPGRRARLQTVAGVRPGINVLSVNLSAARKRLLAHPWIAEAEIQREIPSTLRIRIREHVPAAVVDVGRKFLLNTRGEIFKEWEPADPGGSAGGERARGLGPAAGRPGRRPRRRAGCRGSRTAAPPAAARQPADGCGACRCSPGPATAAASCPPARSAIDPRGPRAGHHGGGVRRRPSRSGWGTTTTPPSYRLLAGPAGVLQHPARRGGFRADRSDGRPPGDRQPGQGRACRRKQGPKEAERHAAQGRHRGRAGHRHDQDLRGGGRGVRQRRQHHRHRDPPVGRPAQGRRGQHRGDGGVHQEGGGGGRAHGRLRDLLGVHRHRRRPHHRLQQPRHRGHQGPRDHRPWTWSG